MRLSESAHSRSRLSTLECLPCPGKIKHSLILHPDDTHIIYPLGSTIVIKNVENTEKQVFLQGPCCGVCRVAHGRVVFASLLDELTRFALHELTHIGHSDRVTCIAISPNGDMLASGQITHMGYLAEIILWDISGIGA